MRADETEASKDDQEDEQLETEGLLIEGEEREYVLELLLREASIGTCVSNQPAIAKPAISKSKRKRNLEKRLLKRARMTGGVTAKTPRKDGERAGGGGEVKHAVKDRPCNPETRGRGAAKEEHSRERQPARPPSTSGRECSA